MGGPPPTSQKRTIEQLISEYICWSPNWNKLYSETGIPHMGIFESPCPFLYGNHQMETVIPIWKTLPYGDFYLNPQMGMNSIWKRVSDWTVPVRKRGPVSIRGFPYRNGYPFHLLPHMETGIRPFHMGMCKSPFPYGNHHMETVCVTWRSPKIRSPFPYGESPYGNGQGESNIPIWGVPVSEQSLFQFGDQHIHHRSWKGFFFLKLTTC